MYIAKPGKYFWKNVKHMWKFCKDSLKTHQNRGPRAMGVLNSESVRKMLSKSCIKVEKGAGKVCFMTETCVKAVRILYVMNYAQYGM